ncbi:hypothetical protein M6B38_342625 [Iris pallida]|uniref:Uncharacterized protein n=1 Tax=Iris pallida TaxID=29817 RepID=A0AAX6GW72_IRIPA|nr:hypothetical protein M6B38_342625 [Iris pallida]
MKKKKRIKIESPLTREKETKVVPPVAGDSFLRWLELGRWQFAPSTPHASPTSSSSSSFRRTGVAVSRRPTRLATSFLQPNSLAHGRRRPSSSAPRSGKRRSLVVVGEVAGQYEEGFEDVETVLNSFLFLSSAFNQTFPCVFVQFNNQLGIK